MRRTACCLLLFVAFTPAAEAKVNKLSMQRAKMAVHHQGGLKPEKIIRCVRLTRRSVKCKARYNGAIYDADTGEPYDYRFYVYTYATLRHGRVKLRDVY